MKELIKDMNGNTIIVTSTLAVCIVSFVLGIFIGGIVEE